MATESDSRVKTLVNEQEWGALNVFSKAAKGWEMLFYGSQDQRSVRGLGQGAGPHFGMPPYATHMVQN